MATSEWTDNAPAMGNQISTEIPQIEKNLEEIKEILDDITDSTVGTTDTASFQIKTLVPQNIWIPAGALIPTDTNGAAIGTKEYATNDIMKDYLAFDGAAEEFAGCDFPMPEGWDRGTIKAKFYWAPGDSACSAADTVEWELGGVAISNDDAIDASLGTTQVISDTVLAGKDGDLHISGATPAITIGGTPALGDLIHFKVSRNVGGTDNMTEDAWLFGVFLQITINTAVTAW